MIDNLKHWKVLLFSTENCDSKSIQTFIIFSEKYLPKLTGPVVTVKLFDAFVYCDKTKTNCMMAWGADIRKQDKSLKSDAFVSSSSISLRYLC